MSKTRYIPFILIVLLNVFTSIASDEVEANERPTSVLIVDGSRSMWGKIDRVDKITILRNALTDNFLRYNGRLNLGIVAYGHRKSDSCQDIGQIQSIKQLDGPTFADSISRIQPKGKTPIAASLRFAAQKLRKYNSPKSIILISDGLENCQNDPCKVSQSLKQKDKQLKIHVIAFDRKKKTQLTALQCIAKNTGSIFASATGEANLKLALSNAFDSSLTLTSSNTWATKQGSDNTQAHTDLRTQPTGQITNPSQAEGIIGQSANDLVPITFLALIKEGGLPVKSDIVWRIFDAKARKKSKFKLISTHRQARPTAALKPGSYLVNAAYGRSHLTKKIEIKKGEPMSEVFVLNVGGLRLGSVLANGKKVSKNSVQYTVYSDERDQFGNRSKIISNAKPGLIIRLNAGLYHIVSQYGDANATVSADVTIEPGKLTEATINHTAAKVSFKLVRQSGGEALANIRWSVITPQGEVVKESAGALPTHILAAGNYTIMARRSGQIFKREFEVKPGDTREIEIVIQ
ncbi:MAG: VWA domain-containing protein [Pseudomonadota bacterium]